MSFRLLKMVKTVLTSPLMWSTNGFKSRMGSSYEEAVRALNSLQSNAEALEKKRATGGHRKGKKLQYMEKYIQRSGLTLEEIDKLSIIHISGTKGKGSTAAYCESILRHQGFKTGFFSSPHLVEVRERIRINGKPIHKELFSSKFWDVFNKLSETKEENDGQMPAYFAFLTVLSCHIFLEERVDVAILEVGIGGEYDSTNFIRHPAVCGITSLGLDHISLLGDTIESIAWNKAGIFKPGVPAVTVEQPAEAMKVIHDRSIERDVKVYVTEPLAEEEKITLGISGNKQRLNAALALQLCKLWRISPGNYNNSAETREIRTKGSICDIPILQLDQLTKEHKEGLSQCKWYGRNQTIHRPGITYYLDGAHTLESIEQCVEWFNTLSQSEEKQIAGKVKKILVFNITGDRKVSAIFEKLMPCNFDAALFTPNLTFLEVNQLHADNVNHTVTDEAKQKRCCSNKRNWDELHYFTKDEAIKILNSLQPKPEVLKQRILDKTRDLYEDIKDMNEFMERTSIGHDDINKLGVIHISGTKGKGSTSAYCESILRHQGFKTGFYSSPHLMEVRERFRVNGKPVSKERFCQMFWLVYQQLYESKEKYGGNMPRVFSFNTLLACHIFREEQVDAMIMEVGIGGEYDQTNIVQRPAVCGVTSLDLDHTDILGDTIESIAWHKAGIFKYSTPAVTSPQVEKAMEILKDRSVERQCSLFAAQPLADEYDHLLTIHGPKQRINAGLALQICKIWNLKRQDHSLSDLKITDKTFNGVPVLQSSVPTPEETKGLSECKWYGRNQVVSKPGITYYLDGAHTKDSMEQCANWFKATSKAEEESIRGNVVKILFFNVTGVRNVPALISYLKPCNFDVAAFSPNKRYADINKNRADEFELSNDDEMKQIQSKKCKTEWDKVCVSKISCSKDIDIGSYHHESGGHFSEYFPCITDALRWITQGRDDIINSITESEETPLPPAPSIITQDTHLQILVTGSLHLVGGVLLQICPGLND